MRFVEKLSAVDVVRAAVGRAPVFYGWMSLGARLAKRLLAHCGREVPVAKIDFGHVGVATGIRGNAYRAAEAALDRLPGREWAEALMPAIGIDLWLIVRKFFFDEYYLKFEFIEFARRYAQEHPGERHSLRIDPERMDGTGEWLAVDMQVSYARNTTALGLLTALALPLFVEFFYRRKGSRSELRVNDSVVAEVDGSKTLAMFSNLFGGLPADRLVFVCEPRNAGALTAAQVHSLRLGPTGARYLRRVVWTYLRQSLRHAHEIHSYGTRLFRLFYLLMQGRAETIEGSGNLYCTYEHLVTYKAIRNAYLAAGGNRSLFVPLNAHVTPQYFHSEILVNYDVMCAAGPHTETLYRKKRALTRNFPATGSYDSQSLVLDEHSRQERVARLRAFADGRTVLTIVSPGICDPTYGHEQKLMALARTVSTWPGICVLIRLKPVPPEEKYANFYNEQTAGCPNILLTGGEYGLFDFLEASDLVVTSISNAAFDLAQAGAQVMFVDYLQDPDLMLCWSAVPEVLLHPQEAETAIADWVADRNGMRGRWAALMRAFAAQIGYAQTDYPAYLRNFGERINEWLPPACRLSAPGERT